MRAHRRCSDESGITIVLVALSLVVLMIFAAFAVDIGGVYAERRQDQTAADVSALAAVQDLQKGEAVLVATAKQYAHDTLGTVLSDADWNSCPSPDGEALPVQASGARCISYSDNRVRVRLPDQFYPTSFGRVAGVSELRHSAFAVAGLESEGFGGVLPFAVTGASSEGGFGCLKSNSNGQASAVCGSSSGNFGYLDFSHYGSATFGTTKSCGSGGTSDRLENNMAMGVDHDLSKVGTVHLTPMVDRDGCPTDIPSPDAADTETGNMSDLVTHGLFFRPTNKGGPIFPDGEPSRLRRQDTDLLSGSGPARIQVHGVSDLDNVGLWRFIPPNYGPGQSTSANIPHSCKRNQFVDSSGNYYADQTSNPNLDSGIASAVQNVSTERDRILALMSRCFTHYRGLNWTGDPVLSLPAPGEAPSGCSGACSDPVFALNSSTTDDPDLYDIQYTPRFGYVPVIADFPSGGSQARTFLRFRAVYIQRLIISTSGSDTVWDPEVAPVPPTTGDYQAVREAMVFVFPDGMLPGGLAGEEAPFEIGVNRFVSLVR